MSTRVLYGTAIFLSSCLLFLMEPMAGKWLVPQLGGSAAVWTTCLVFFQTALLLGYLCAYWLSTRLRLRAQTMAYAGLLLAGLAQSGANLGPYLHASTTHPVASTFWLLAALMGLPFLVLSATNPLLQSWYASQSGGAPGDLTPPYRLFALSNFGSLLALLIYPWLIEPRFSLREQSLAWLGGFVLLAVACVGILGRGGSPRNLPMAKAASANSGASAALPGLGAQTLWLLLAACGSLLLCAVTSHLSQNIAAIPLLWVIPLVAYLLSFVVAFQGERFYPRRPVMGLLAVTLGVAGYLLHDQRVDVPGFLVRWVPSFAAPQVAVSFFCAALFLACLFCHAELYRLRPSPQHATSFYLSIAAGGSLGALLVGVVAPAVLSSNPELGCGLIFTAALALAVSWRQGPGWRLLWTATCLAMMAAVFIQGRNFRRDTIFQERSFYGTLRVTQISSEDGGGPGSRTLCHGAIIHGTQLYENGMRTTPTAYYSRDSGVGLALDLCCGERPRRVGVIGLGAGTLAAYGRQGDVFRFYEIDPLVERVARHFFTYLGDSAAAIQIVPGDARLSLSAETPQAYDVLAVDAFSGDAIPVHLLTLQAMELYRRHLRPEGILAIHVTNRYLELAPVVEQQAERAGLSAVLVVTGDNDALGEYGSEWILVTANREFLARPEIQQAGQPIDPPQRLRLWTDDYNSLLPLLKKPEPDE